MTILQSRPWCVLVLLPVLAWAGRAAAQVPPALEEKIYDVRALEALLTAPHHEMSGELPLYASQGPAGETAYRRMHGEEIPPEGEDLKRGWLDVVEQHLGAEVLSDLRFRFTRSNGLFHVRATAAVHASIAAVLRALEARYGAAVTVELALVDASSLRDFPAAILDARAAEELLRTAPVTSRAWSRVPMGRRARIRAGEQSARVADYDVEVAQESVAADPLINTINEGLDAEVLVHRDVVDGWLFVDIRGTACEREGSRRLRQGGSPGGVIDLPVLRSAIVASCARVENGGALIAGTAGTPGALWVLRARVDAAAGGEIEERTSFIPLAPLVTVPSVPFRPWVNSVMSGAGAGVGGEPAPFNQSWSNGDLVAAVTSELAGDEPAEGVSESPRLRFLEYDLVCTGSAEARAQIRKRAAVLTARRERNVAIEARAGVVAPDAAALREARAGRFDELVAQLPVAIAGATRLGSGMLAVAGREQGYLKDYDIEFAEDAVASDPIVSSIFTGSIFQARAFEGYEHRIAAEIAFEWHEETAPLESVELGAPHLGSVELPHLARVDVATVVFLESGRWELVHEAPLPGKGRTLVLLVRAR